MAGGGILELEAPRDEAMAEEAAQVHAAQRGDARAFEQLYRRHRDRIYGLCWRLHDGDRAKAEQSTQDAFVRAWDKLGGFRGDAQFGTWLHALTVNLVLGEKRLLKRWVTFEDSGEGEDMETALVEHPQASAGLKMDLERALARLPRGARTVLLLHDVEGYQHGEIAAATGIAVGTSKAQLHRARKLMKEYLQ
ncbi:MAG TPA: sigma-70 family RNA polymerase sigma factor [Nevskiaceae bacterium]|nr:sigma-70 family RNA polymerase sigma factor [Nevskiaceae bacterium]